MKILANLDCEARWAGVALPAAVARRVSAYAALLAALAPEDDVEVWAPAPVDEARLVGPLRPRLRVGAPPRWDLAWADPGAKAANDRAATLALAASLGAALPGACTAASLAELDARAAALGTAWVAKARWTAAGRDRAHGTGAPTGELRARCERLLARHGALVVEPWCARLFDVGLCGAVAADGTVALAAPHSLLVDARGQFAGIDLAPPPLADDERARLDHVARACGASLAARGYRGPFALDAFVHESPTGRALHPLCELNARHTFGHVARALATRLGSSRLGFASPPPPDATVLVAPGDDEVTAWVA